MSMSTSGEVSIEKNGRREIIYQQACEEGALRGAASLLLTLCPNTASAPIVWSADRLTKERYEHNGNTIKYLKSPSVERNAGDF
jgi:hypothetical protein